MDIVNRENHFGIIKQTHNGAHRNHVENIKQIEKLYFWTEMRRQMKQYVRNYVTCNKNKYDRYPRIITMGEAPIPKHVGEQIQLDIGMLCSKIKIHYM